MVAIQRASTNVAMVQNVGIYSLTNICRSSDVAIHKTKLKRYGILKILPVTAAVLQLRRNIVKQRQDYLTIVT